MNKEMTDKLMKSLLLISTIAFLAGALFKLQHWAYGDRLLFWGILVNLILSSFEISRLRKIISKSENEKSRSFDII